MQRERGEGEGEGERGEGDERERHVNRQMLCTLNMYKSEHLHNNFCYVVLGHIGVHSNRKWFDSISYLERQFLTKP